MEKLACLCFLEQILNRNQKAGLQAEVLDQEAGDLAEAAAKDVLLEIDPGLVEARDAVLAGKDELGDLTEVDLPEVLQVDLTAIVVAAVVETTAAVVDSTANLTSIS